MTAADVLALFSATFMSFLVAFALGALFWVAGSSSSPSPRRIPN
jgi:hypothetical protein